MNYNLSLLRSLQPTLHKELDAVAQQLGQGGPAGKDLGTTVHQITASLQMIHCHALKTVAESLEKGVEGWLEADRRGWNEPQRRQAAKALARLAQALRQQLEQMVEGEAVLPLQLWPEWSEVVRATVPGAQPRPEQLFEPDARFEEAFNPLEPRYLSEVVEGAIERIKEGVQAWVHADRPDAADEAARQVHQALDQVGQLRHRKSYYLYWLVWRARLTVGLLRGNTALLDHKARWAMDLRPAVLELEKFAQDHRVLHHDRLMEALLPVLEDRWPETWFVGHPVLAELNARLNLVDFWHAVEQLQGLSPADKEAYATHQDDLQAAASQLHAAAQALMQDNQEHQVRAMSKAVVSLINKRSWAPGADLEPMWAMWEDLGQLLADQKKANLSPEGQEELAASVLLTEEMFERPLPLSSALAQRVALQAQRSMAAWHHKMAVLKGLPTIEWDATRQAQQQRRSAEKVIQELHQDVTAVEKLWNEAVAGDAPLTEKAMEEAERRMKLASAVLGLAQRPAAGQLAQQIGQFMDRHRQAPTDQWAALRHQVAPALATLTAYLLAWQRGEAGVSVWLRAPLREFLPDPQVEALIQQERQALREDTVSASTLVPEMPASGAPEAEESLDSVDGSSDPLFADDESDAPAEADAPASVDDPLAGLMEEPLAPQSDAEGNAHGSEPSLEADPLEGLWEEPSALETSAEANEEGHAPEHPETTPAPEAAETHSGLNDQEADALPLGDRLRQGAVWDAPETEDRELVELFFEEAKSVLSELAHTRWQSQGELEDARRGFHTLRGAGRTAGYEAFGEAARWVEAVLDARLETGQGHLSALEERRAAMVQWFVSSLQALEEGQDVGASLEGQGLWDLLHPSVEDDEDRMDHQDPEPRDEDDEAIEARAFNADDRVEATFEPRLEGAEDSETSLSDAETDALWEEIIGVQAVESVLDDRLPTDLEDPLVAEEPLFPEEPAFDVEEMPDEATEVAALEQAPPSSNMPVAQAWDEVYEALERLIDAAQAVGVALDKVRSVS